VFNAGEESFSSPEPPTFKNFEAGGYFFAIMSALDDNKNKILLFFGRIIRSPTEYVRFL
jgi:hypothetical protein